MRKNDVPDLNQLFEMLAAGRMPNFLEVMSALSDISTIFPEVSCSSQELPGDKKGADPPYLYPPEQNRCPSCGL